MKNYLKFDIGVAPKLLLLIFPLLLFSLTSCAEKNNIKHMPDIADKEEKIDQLAKRYLELGRFSGNILVADKNGIIFNRFYGMADYESEKTFSEETTFKIGSLSEMFTEAVIKDMTAEGLIDFNDPISILIPEIEADYTVQELVAHESGLPQIETIKEENQIPYSTIEYANVAVLGENNGKSNFGYNILGLLIERIHNNSFDKVVEEYARKWNLKNTYYDKNDKSLEAKGYLFHNFRGEGMELQESPVYELEEAFSSKGIKSTASDLLNLSRIFSEENIATHGYLENDGFSYSFTKKSNGLTIIILSNRRHPVAKEISNSIEAIFSGNEYEIPLPRKEIEIDTKIYSEYAGTYAMNPNMKLEIINSNDSLFLMMGPNKMHLIPQSQNQFYLEPTDAAIRFEREPKGKISKAILYDGFLEGTEITKVEE